MAQTDRYGYGYGNYDMIPRVNAQAVDNEIGKIVQTFSNEK